MLILRRLVLAAAMVLAGSVSEARADSISLAWDPNPAQDNVLGYIVYVGTASGAYTASYDVGSQTSFVFTGAVAGQEYFFAVAAYNALGTGPYSDESSRYSNAPPSLQQPSTKVSGVGETTSLQLVGQDPYGDALTYSATGLPAGLTIAENTGLISGAATTLGVYSVTATVSDGLFQAARTFSWRVDTSPPVVTITSPTNQPSHTTFTQTLALSGTASDDLGPVTSVTWVNSRGGSGAATGTASWSVPNISLYAGLNVITVQALDAAGRSSTDVINVTWVETEPPTISLVTPTSGSTHLATTTTISVGGTAKDNVAVVTVPWVTDRGASGNASFFTNEFGTFWSISTLPLQPGINVLTVTASDAAGNSTSTVLTITRNLPPALTNPGAQSLLQGIAAIVNVTASDSDTASLSWSASNLPAGLSIHPTTGVISGTPTSIGAATATVTVSDGSTSVQASFAVTVSSPFPAAATPTAPTGSTLSTTPAFTWAAVSNAGYYFLRVDDVASGVIERWYTPAQAGCAASGVCSAVLPSPLAAGRVQWQVLTWNTYGYGPWSSLASFIIDLADPATPTPVTLAPSGPIATRTPSYSWNPVSNVIWYQISVVDAQSVVRDYWFTPTESCTASPCGATPNVQIAIGPAQWQVRAWRSTGAGAWSAPVPFETADGAPGKATLIDPSAPVGTPTPLFTWNAVLGTSYYLLRIVDRDGSVIERWYRPVNASCSLGTGTCSANPGVNLGAGLATWQVLTWNGSGYGPWSNAQNFSVDIADPSAGVPTPVSPLVTVTTPNPSFTWGAVAGAVTYRLSLRNNGGQTLQWWIPSSAAACASECTITLQAGLVNGTAEWQVQAWTAVGHGDFSAPVGLTVTIAAPAAPVLVTPSGSTTATPAFTWNASSSATLYYVRVIDASGPRVDRWLTPVAAGCGLGTGTCTLDVSVTLNPGAGSWQVIAWNPSGYSSWSDTKAFVVP